MKAEFNLLNSELLYTIIIHFIINRLLATYLKNHTIYGKFNIGNYLIYQFEEKMYKKLQSNLDQKMLDINIDLHSFYSNKDDYIDEITKQNNPNIQDGETILKLD